MNLENIVVCIDSEELTKNFSLNFIHAYNQTYNHLVEVGRVGKLFFCFLFAFYQKMRSVFKYAEFFALKQKKKKIQDQFWVNTT